MSITITRLDLEAITRDPKVLEGIAPVAGSIASDANRASRDAKIGITYEIISDAVRIGPAGAPAIALEFGTATRPARRYVKTALDRHEI